MSRNNYFYRESVGNRDFVPDYVRPHYVRNVHRRNVRHRQSGGVNIAPLFTLFKSAAPSLFKTTATGASKLKTPSFTAYGKQFKVPLGGPPGPPGAAGVTTGLSGLKQSLSSTGSGLVTHLGDTYFTGETGKALWNSIKGEVQKLPEKVVAKAFAESDRIVQNAKNKLQEVGLTPEQLAAVQSIIQKEVLQNEVQDAVELKTTEGPKETETAVAVEAVEKPGPKQSEAAAEPLEPPEKGPKETETAVAAAEPLETKVEVVQAVKEEPQKPAQSADALPIKTFSEICSPIELGDTDGDRCRQKGYDGFRPSENECIKYPEGEVCRQKGCMGWHPINKNCFSVLQ